MSIFSNILAKILPGAQPTPAPAPLPATEAAPAPAPVAVSAPAPAVAAPPPSIPVSDVAAILDGKLGADKLNWRTSIVDLMKLLGLDSSLAARKELAKELLYDGDMKDSATMNIWLHKQVMSRLAAYGGSVPPELL